MIGAAKTALSSGVVIISNYSCFISPKSIITFTIRNGSNTTSNISANIISGLGPFTYLWEVDNSLITIANPTEESTTFTASGFNEEVEGVVTLTVIDIGNGNAEAVDTSPIVFIFETNL